MRAVHRYGGGVAKKRRGRKRPIHRKVGPTRPAHPPEKPELDLGDGDLISAVRATLREDSPAGLLEVVSGIVELLDPRGSEDSEIVPATSLEELVASFIDVSFAETTAILTVMEQLLPADNELRIDIGAELLRRSHPMPLWVRDLRDGRVHIDVERMDEDLGDGYNCVLGLSFDSGAAITIFAFVDNNAGGAVKHAFLVDEGLASVMARIHEGAFGPPPSDSIGPWDPAQARATMEVALEAGRHAFPAGDDDPSWPTIRPLLAWALRLLPEGGTPVPSRAWSFGELDALSEQFWQSPEAANLEGVEAELAVHAITEFGGRVNEGGPLRWSPVVVEVFLVFHMPTEQDISLAAAGGAIEVLRAWVRFAHRLEGISAEDTEATLAAIDEYGPEFETMVAQAQDGPGQGREIAKIVLEIFARSVGGNQVLETLTAEPLPDEPFNWGGIPDDIHDRVEEHLVLLDSVANAHFDVEHRTAMRRFLARVAVAAPEIFRRKSATKRGAAAIAWVICNANESVSKYGTTVQKLLSWFDVTGSVAQRAEPMLKALGVWDVTNHAYPDWGTPDFFTGAQRARLIAHRDEAMGML